MSRLFAKPLPGGSFLMLLLFVAVLISAIAVSYSAHWNRQLLNTLYGELNERDKSLFSNAIKEVRLNAFGSSCFMLKTLSNTCSAESYCF